jgi:uncharacterized protein (TIGR02466 family)
MANVELWFPVAIYSENNLFSKEQNAIWTKYLLDKKETVSCGGEDWYGNTYTTHGSKYNVKKDPEFAQLITTITEHVNEFAKLHNCNESYECSYAWANIADANSFQEFHTHNGSIFSLVYYVAAPEGSGQIVFEDPKEPDMKPLKTVKQRNQLSFTKISQPATEGGLIIFRSYMRHLVQPGTNTTPRISISMNFN